MILFCLEGFVNIIKLCAQFQLNEEREKIMAVFTGFTQLENPKEFKDKNFFVVK